MFKVFCVVLVFLCCASFGTIVVFRATKPDADITIFVSIFVASFTTLVGMLMRFPRPPR